MYIQKTNQIVNVSSKKAWRSQARVLVREIHHHSILRIVLQCLFHCFPRAFFDSANEFVQWMIHKNHSPIWCRQSRYTKRRGRERWNWNEYYGLWNKYCNQHTFSKSRQWHLKNCEQQWILPLISWKKVFTCIHFLGVSCLRSYFFPRKYVSITL